jgi:hypothetical protein
LGPEFFDQDRSNWQRSHNGSLGGQDVFLVERLVIQQAVIIIV